MKIVFTGGGTGGHFYPIIAVAEALGKLLETERRLPPSLYFMAPGPYDEQALFESNIAFIKSPAGKVRRYKALSNITDFFVTLSGVVWAFFKLLDLGPDVVFSKGGYGSVPTVLAAALLRIPIVIHESDSRPGRANLLASKYAKRIAITYPDSLQYFPKKTQKNIAVTGIPIRALLAKTQAQGAAQELGLESSIPTILILGGSTGSVKINDTILTALPDLVSFSNVIHQTGKNNFKETELTSGIVLKNNPNASRYHVFPYLTKDSMRQAAGVATLVISRAGSTSITEISLWHKPSILIPIPESISHDQKTNAYAYARSGAAAVLEEENMTPHVLASEAKRISLDPQLCAKMGELGSSFANPKSAEIIARELITIASSHLPKEEVVAA